MKCVGISDVGRLRQRNEDAYFIHEEPLIAIVSDGMGGAPYGDVASKQTIHSFSQLLLKDKTWNQETLLSFVNQTNQDVVEYSIAHPKTHGMGATLVAFLKKDNQAWLINVGDSRAYGLKGNQLLQLSDDHTMMNEFLKRNNHQEPQIDQRFKHMLTSVIGMPNGCIADITSISDPYDMILLCSDGLSNLISQASMIEVLTSQILLDQKAQKLIELANQAGGSDNITLIIIDMGGDTHE
ncbi:MAG: protein phosphatase 2C domain-containing protein [Erysipelotrichaceae bacterium]|nr:protein phosphatase 2C domain-containing protein [Erysipelotrichaceae bacterium]